MVALNENCHRESVFSGGCVRVLGLGWLGPGASLTGSSLYLCRPNRSCMAPSSACSHDSLWANFPSPRHEGEVRHLVRVFPSLSLVCGSRVWTGGPEIAGLPCSWFLETSSSVSGVYSLPPVGAGRVMCAAGRMVTASLVRAAAFGFLPQCVDVRLPLGTALSMSMLRWPSVRYQSPARSPAPPLP